MRHGCVSREILRWAAEARRDVVLFSREWRTRKFRLGGEESGRFLLLQKCHVAEDVPKFECTGAQRYITTREDAVNGYLAKNVLARGHRVAACGEAVSRCVSSAASKKQEPAEATVRETAHV